MRSVYNLEFSYSVFVKAHYYQRDFHFSKKWTVGLNSKNRRKDQVNFEWDVEKYFKK